MSAGFPFQFRNQNYLFQYKIGFSFFCAFFFLLFITLSIWQSYRYSYKKELVASYQTHLQESPQPFTNHKSEDLQFRQVSVKGKYLSEHTFFVSRTYENKLGVEVFTPLKIENEQRLLLIDRGWLPQESIADIRTPAQAITITGYIKLPHNQFILGNNYLNPGKSPIVLQKLDLDELHKITQLDFYPFSVRLNAKESYGFTRDWPIVISPPERHLGYAVQWLALALVVFIAYFCFCCERIKNA